MQVMKSTGEQEAAGNLRYLKGIGPKRAQALEKLGIGSIRDLLFYFPRRYEDRTQFTPIKDILPGHYVTIKGEVLACGLKSRRFARPVIFEAMIGDSGSMIPAVWFNQAYLKSSLQVGKGIILYGKADLYNNRLQINSPEFELIDESSASAIHAGRITPVYSLTEGVFQKSLRLTLSQILEKRLHLEIQEYLPQAFRQFHKLMELPDAVGEMHFPSNFEKLQQARRRIVFDEFFIFEINLLKKIERMKTKYRAPVFSVPAGFIQSFQDKLSFTLTECQKKAMNDVVQDTSAAVPMNRLLMGDVGSGKTMVAAFSMLAAEKSGKQSALLVPTEILAVQHYDNLKKLLKGFGLSVKILTASTPSAERDKTVAFLAQGKIDCIVGTHSLIQEEVRFKDLGLVVIDEQHKFGVHQRSRLLERSPRPHQLVMTATPIPRTLALTVFGDLDISVMKTMPKGRKAVKTYWIARDKQEKVLEHILKKVHSGEQAYFIFPMIDETEKSDLLAAKKEFERLSKGFLKTAKMGLVHGKLSPEERGAVMKSFREGVTQILVATSVIEVGVDNPNATMMVIENAERFGLSQLHQMRGRIGRGDKESECFLFGEPATDEGKKRLRILTKTHDGFIIAEEDLKLRGPGDFYGTRQSGKPVFQVAHPIFDEEILIEARDAAKLLIRDDLLKKDSSWAALKNYLDQMPIHY